MFTNQAAKDVFYNNVGKISRLKDRDLQSERVYQRPTTVKTSKDQHKDTSPKHFLKPQPKVGN